MCNQDPPLPAIHNASKMGDPRAILAVLSTSANDLNCEDWTGAVPLFYAVESGSAECVRLLLAAGADATGGTALMSPIVHAARLNNFGVVRMLVDAGANPDRADDADGATPLHFAALRGNIDMVQFLLVFGVRVNVPECDGNFAIDYAMMRGKNEIIELLKSHGAVSSQS